MADLQSTNVSGTLCVNGIAIGGGKDFYFCCISGSGTYTPSSGLVSADGMLDITLVGGGGGGSSCNCNFSTCGAGGGGGAIFQGIRKMTDSTTACTITVGSGGSGATSVNTAGTSGGDTIFDQCLLPGAIAFGGGGGNTCRGTGGGTVNSSYRGGSQGSMAGGGAFSIGTFSSPGIASYSFSKPPVLITIPSRSLDTNPAAGVGFGSTGGGSSCEGSFYASAGGTGMRNMGNGGAGAANSTAGGGGGSAGQNAGGFGNGGGGTTGATAGNGSDGIVILKWVE